MNEDKELEEIKKEYRECISMAKDSVASSKNIIDSVKAQMQELEFYKKFYEFNYQLKHGKLP